MEDLGDYCLASAKAINDQRQRAELLEREVFKRTLIALVEMDELVHLTVGDIQRISSIAGQCAHQALLDQHAKD